MFVFGQAYKRTDLHNKYGGQRQGGASTPKNHPFIFLFTGQSGERYGYRDDWEAGLFRYTGEGQSGDMKFERGNKAILDHSKDGKALYLFEQIQKGYVRFKGQFTCVDFEERPGTDKDQKARQIIVFSLAPVSSYDGADGIGFDEIKNIGVDLTTADLAELRRRAYEAALKVRRSEPKESKRLYYERSKTIRLYVLVRSKGNCEACKKPAPFNRKNGFFYLEPHHTKLISESGLDDLHWVGAVCPNCHREIHYGIGGQKLNEALKKYIYDKEKNQL